MLDIIYIVNVKVGSWKPSEIWQRSTPRLVEELCEARCFSWPLVPILQNMREVADKRKTLRTWKRRWNGKWSRFQIKVDGADEQGSWEEADDGSNN